MVSISFQPWKTEKIKAGCLQTIRPIRAKGGPFVGCRLQLYNQQRVKGKSCKLFDTDPVCTALMPLVMTWEQGRLNLQLERDCRVMGRARLRKFAKADGFNDLAGFEEFFSRYFVKADRFEGVLIEWRHPEPYRPSNGEQGKNFRAVWCNKCSKEKSCKWLGESVLHGFTSAWIYDDVGTPVCTEFKDRSEVAAARRRQKTAHLYQRREDSGQGNLLALLPGSAEEYRALERDERGPQQNLFAHAAQRGNIPEAEAQALRY